MAKLFENELKEWRSLLPSSEICDEDLANYVRKMTNGDTQSRDYLRGIYENVVKRMCEQKEDSKMRGFAKINIEYKDGAKELLEVNNTILQLGKQALTKCLTNDVNDPYDFYIESMVFGTNGAVGGTAKYVDESRTGLFGTTLLTKSVISSIDTAAPSTAIFTSVVTFDEGNGSALNEMALKMKNGELYSMLTFPDVNKTSSIQLTINWYISNI